MNDGLDDDDYPDDDDDDDINTTNTTSNTSKITVDEAFASYVGQIGRGQLKQFFIEFLGVVTGGVFDPGLGVHPKNARVGVRER